VTDTEVDEAQPKLRIRLSKLRDELALIDGLVRASPINQSVGAIGRGHG
jgi:hypothetical protein